LSLLRSALSATGPHTIIIEKLAVWIELAVCVTYGNVTMIRILFLVASLLAFPVQAATPRQMDVLYDLYRNGHKLGQVADTFTRSGTLYTLVSETRAIGPLKMFWPGIVRLTSVGQVTPRGLRPAQFRHARSAAPDKLATAHFDWERHNVSYQYKDESWQVSGLQEGAQDQLSQLYQFMFMPSLPGDYVQQVVSGRDLKEHRYTRSDGGAIQTPLGELVTQQYQRVTEQTNEKSVTVWISPGYDNLPVRIRVSEDGVTFEQRLVRASVKG
jgi:hypothetical protein